MARLARDVASGGWRSFSALLLIAYRNVSGLNRIEQATSTPSKPLIENLLFSMSAHRSSYANTPSGGIARSPPPRSPNRSEEHTSELQSLMRISYAAFCLNKKKHYSNNEED